MHDYPVRPVETPTALDYEFLRAENERLVQENSVLRTQLAWSGDDGGVSRESRRFIGRILVGIALVAGLVIAAGAARNNTRSRSYQRGFDAGVQASHQP